MRRAAVRVVIAPNAFKGSLSVWEACRALDAGVRAAFPSAETFLLPISDGGDGLIDALLAAKGGTLVHVPVRGPLGEKRRAAFARLPGRAAVIEMARASGLALVPEGRRDVMRATSFGTGQLIAAALRGGARTIIVGMGGSAANDGGAGMAQALGARLLDRRGRELGVGAAALLDLDRIDVSGLFKSLRGVRVIAVSDVTNPLLGPKGSARTYGPQKGATKAQVAVLERALARCARIAERDLGVRAAALPGAGAAGGLGFGLKVFLAARLVPGSQFVLGRIDARRKLAGASAALTGEGAMDQTSFFGKAPVEFARLAAARGVPTACVCGRLEPGLKLGRAGIETAVSLAQAGARGEDAIGRAAFWAKKAAALAVKRLLPAVALLWLAGAAGAAVSKEIEAVDQLYLHRNVGLNLRESAARLEQMAKDGPEDPEVLWRLGRSLVRVGETLKEKKERVAAYQRAEDLIKKSTELAPKSADAHFWLGVAMGRRGQARGILNSLSIVAPLKREMEIVLALDYNYGGAHHVLGEMDRELPFFAGGSKKKALEEFEKALKLSPDYAVNYVSLAEAYIDAGRKDKAREVLDRLFALKNPSDPAEYPDNIKDGKALLEKLK